MNTAENRPARRNGQTFRYLCRALELASAGERVFYHSTRHDTAHYYFTRAADMAESYAQMINGGGMTISFAGGGFVRFLGPKREAETRGYPNARNIQDD